MKEDDVDWFVEGSKAKTDGKDLMSCLNALAIAGGSKRDIVDFALGFKFLKPPEEVKGES